MHKDPTLLLQQKCTAPDITINVSPSNLILTDKIEHRIEEIWQEKIIESTKKGKPVFNGNSYRLNSWEQEGSKLILNLATFDYKHRLGLITLIQSNEIDHRDYPQAGCFVGSTVKTSDEKYILVELSGKSMNNNTYDVLGGMVETDVTISSDGTFLFNVLYQELEEEAGLHVDDIADCSLELFLQGSWGHYGFHFYTEVNLTEQEITNRFQTNTDIDIANLLFLNRNEYLVKLLSLGPVKEIIAKNITLN